VSLSGDPNLRRFAALVVIIESCPLDSSAWFQLHHDVLFNADLVKRLQNVIANVRVETRVMDPRGDAIAADTTLAQIDDAESKADWYRRQLYRSRLPQPFVPERRANLHIALRSKAPLPNPIQFLSSFFLLSVSSRLHLANPVAGRPDLSLL
jgi:hypothetical protein